MGVPAHSCAVTCAHVMTYARGGGRPCNSGAMFRRPLRASSHQLEALFAGPACVLFPSSSLPYGILLSTWEFTRYHFFCQQTKTPEKRAGLKFSLCETHKAGPAERRNFRGRQKKPGSGGKNSEIVTVLDCKPAVKLLSYTYVSLTGRGGGPCRPRERKIP